MKILFTLSLIFVTTLAISQESKKNTKETISVNKEKQTNQYAVYYKNYTGVATIPKKELEEMDTLTVRSLDVNKPMVIVSFEISLLVNGALKSFVTSGNVLSNEVRKIFKLAKTNSKIYIDNITVKNSITAEIKKVQGMTIKVK